MIDQGNSYHDYVNFDSEKGPDRPGLFQASVTGIGHLVAYIGYEKVAELKLNLLVSSSIDVFQAGKVRDALDLGLDPHIQSLQTAWPEEFPDDFDEWKSDAAQTWLSILRRLLLRVRNIRHGGAFLISADQSFQGLSVKHKINYDRLRSALQRHALANMQHSNAADFTSEEYMEKDAEDMPVGLHLEEIVAGYDLQETRNELDGAIWFVSLLTRVDGLVLLNQNLEVRGFGVEITVSEEPPEIFVASDPWGTESLLKKVDYLLYGTRHRSMMRYCWKFPGSVGFVMSQDGDVRVMTKVGPKLLVWENIQLQLPKFVRPKRRKRVRSRRRRRRETRGTEAGE